MEYILREAGARDPDGKLCDSLSPVIKGLGMSLIEISVFRSKASSNSKGRGGNVQIKAVVLSCSANGITGIEDCSKVHRAVMPRLELAFPERDIYLEVSSPGIDRQIKEGREFVHYIGREVRCYCSDISDWISGALLSSDEEQIVLRREGAETALPYKIIAKARLNGSPGTGG